EPRPSLEKYKYPMPGEDKIRHSELMMFSKSTGKLTRLKPKWKDESYLDTRWLPNGELRVLRRDRMRREVEYGIVNPETGDFKTLFSERFADVGMVTQGIRYLDKRKELVWWSERSGWAHFYLYGLDGKFKNAITRGKFRASRIIEVDEEKGLMWFRGNGREKGENIYFEHLYRVRLDGGDLTLLDEGNATHRSQLSKSRKFVVDNCNRVDMSPISVLRNGEGELVMDLEKADMSQLKQMGWKAPERFVVKAADGVTDLYGNMYKPFDFDPNKKYPLIAHVYPGPQTEGVSHTFSSASRLQELAQVGFIVIQVGHRGGTPARSKAYASYGYFNMRDYPLEDKKTAIEQLAAKHSFIDIDRIGIFGHSGGGFMTAAALLKPPYNKFFKVGVSTSGNHDNNVYNNSWAERYHGLKEAKEKKKTTDKKGDSKEGDTKKDDDKKGDTKKDDNKKGDTKKGDTKKDDDKKGDTKKDGDKKGDNKKDDNKKDDDKKDGDKKDGDKKEQGKDKIKENENDSLEKKTRFDIKIATNAELAANLEGKLLLVHGEIDNNVHPAGTMRLVDALIKANKRFDML
ncbi:MAG TPA: S9 family peptidase, partial [Planctomycetes bacterium]|nr:S9 family peptidase [Planctomycetota bacterium]